MTKVKDYIGYILWAIFALSVGFKLAHGAAMRYYTVGSVLDDGDLSDTATTATIDMCPEGIGKCYEQLTLLATYTAGTSTDAQVYCSESNTDGGFARIAKCDDSTTNSTCTSATLTYDISSVTVWSTTIRTGARYVQCVYDDSADGTGKVDVIAVIMRESDR